MKKNVNLSKNKAKGTHQKRAKKRGKTWDTEDFTT